MHTYNIVKSCAKSRRCVGPKCKINDLMLRRSFVFMMVGVMYDINLEISVERNVNTYCTCLTVSNLSYPVIHPSQSIEVEEGQTLEVRCSISSTEGLPKALYWQGVWKSKEEIHQQWADNFTRTLVIRNITGKDAGIYQCFYNSSTVQTKRGLSIRVISKCK